MKFLILFLFSFYSFGESDLGTQSRFFESFNKEYKTAVSQAMPTFKTEILQQKLQRVFKKYSRGLQGTKIRNLKALGDAFKLPPMELRRRGQTFYEDPKGKFAAEVNIREGRVQFYQSLDKLAPISRERAKAQLPQVIRAHTKILQKLGIPNNQLLLKKTNFLLLQGQKNTEGGEEVKTKIEVDETATYALRQLDGFILEESYLKFFSKNPKQLEGIDVVWPDFKFHPEIRRMALKKKAKLQSEILQKITKSEGVGKAINVRMAVVLRPVLTRNTRSFVPSMKVGVYSKKGDAGNLFYVDLLAQRLNYQNEDLQDKEQ
jgi:hypothetical protein